MRGAARAAGLALLLAAAGAGAGCKSFRSSDDPVARDQEIVRDIAWRYHSDPRFDEVRVQCEARDVLLTGRVTTKEARRDAERIASETRDVGRVTNRIEVRPK